MPTWRWHPAARCPERDRAARRFRHHIQTPHNPRGRVVRLLCALCDVNIAITRFSQAHHIDYARWWIVIWLCEEHHRLIERPPRWLRDRLKRSPTMLICDYSSLLRLHPKRHSTAPVRRRESGADVPF